MDNKIIKRIKDIGNNLFLKKKSGKIEESTITDDIDITKYLKFGNYNEIVEEFNKLFIENIGKEYKDIFNRNIKEVKIRDGKIKVKENGIVYGEYSPSKNKINILKEDNERIIDVKERLMHELLHMASEREKNRSAGLMYVQKLKDGNYALGRGINEGYTEYLNQKYFSRNTDASYYYYEKVIAEGIERLIGKEQMLKCYFHGGFNSLINEMLKFDRDQDPNKILKTLFSIDKLYQSGNKFVIHGDFKDVQRDIIKLYENKIDYEYKMNFITEEEYQRKRFLDIKLYLEKGFIYGDKASVMEKEECYMITGAFQTIHIPKEELGFKPDVVLPNARKNR